MRPFFSLLPFLFAILFFTSCSDTNTVAPPAATFLFTSDSITLITNRPDFITSKFQVSKQTKVSVSLEGECNVSASDSVSGIHPYFSVLASNDSNSIAQITLYPAYGSTAIIKGLNQEFDVSSFDPNLAMTFEVGFTKNTPSVIRKIKLKNIKVQSVQ